MPFTKHRRGHMFFMMLVFSCMGITTEVVFTALVSFIKQTPLCGKPPLALAGFTYVWMIFIYALIPIIGHYGYDKIKEKNIIIRLTIYVTLIFIVEFISGFILQQTLGSCPWQYTTGWHIMGLIRLDFFPAWAFFCWLVERLYVFMNERMIQ